MATIKHNDPHPDYPNYRLDRNQKPARWGTTVTFTGDFAKANEVLNAEPFDPAACVELGLGGNTDEQQQAVSDYLDSLIPADENEEDEQV